MMRYCSGKVVHKTKGAAFATWKRTGKNVQMNVYACEKCRGWHLGTSRSGLRKMDRIGQLLDQLRGD